MAKKELVKKIKLTQVGITGTKDKEFEIDLPENFFPHIKMLKKYYIQIGSYIYKIDKYGKIHSENDISDIVKYIREDSEE